MNRRAARHTFAITGRLLLVLALLLATGPWAQLLAAARTAAHMMNTAQHAGASAKLACCKDAGSALSVPDCVKHASACVGICGAVYGPLGTCTLPVALAFTGLPSTTATSLPRSGVHAPSPFISPALRPPISL